jgi:predicted ester cyclase
MPYAGHHPSVSARIHGVTTTEANKQLVRDYADAFNRGDIDRLREIFSPDAVIQGVLGWGGLDVVVPIWEELHAAFGIELLIEDLVAEGDTVAARYTERGRFVAPFRGEEPTGKPFELVAMEWFIVRDGRIVRRWGARDHASQMRQLGTPLK